jgi:dTDP-glucose 4,6-dehydratase
VRRKLDILISGGAGFIGSNFARMLLDGTLSSKDSINSVTIIDILDYSGSLNNLGGLLEDSRLFFHEADINDFDLMDKLTKGKDLVINFAAKSHVDKSIKNPHPFFETNVLGMQNLLECARLNEVKTFIQVSTDEVYGSTLYGFFGENSALSPSSPYSASKASADLICQAYFKTYDMDVRITRCTNNYGPYQHPEKFIPLVITKALQNKKIPIYGSGLNKRDWLHVSDHCNAIWLVATRGEAGEIYNISGGEEITNLALCREILAILGSSDAAIDFVEDRLGHDFRYAVDDSKLREITGYSPQVSFKTGLKSTVTWYIDNWKLWKNHY